MARLQELQHTVTGGTKLVAGVSLSPRSGRNYLRTSLRCKQESLRFPTLSLLRFISFLHIINLALRFRVLFHSNYEG